MEIKESESTVVITLSGSLDITNVGPFSAEVDRLCTLSGKNIEIDMEEVSYVDSTGVSCLLRLYKHQKQQGAQFCITRISEKASSVISLCSLSETLNAL
jgi:anti-anti-sigma factor